MMIGKLLVLLLSSIALGSPLALKSNVIEENNLRAHTEVASLETPTMNAAESSDLYCKIELSFGTVMTTYYSHEYHSEEEYVNDEMNAKYMTFNFYHVTFYQDNCVAYIVNANEYVVDANGHKSFTYVTNSGFDKVTTVSLLKYSIHNFTIKNCPSLNLSTGYILGENFNLTLDNCTVGGAGADCYTTLFKVQKGGIITLANNTFFKDMYFSGARGILFNNEGEGTAESKLIVDETSGFEDIYASNGVVYMDYEQAKVENVTFRGCSATYGGAIYQCAGYINNCNFYDCHSNQRSGAIYMYGKACYMNSCFFQGCTSSCDGGAVCMNARYSKIESCMFNNCKAGIDGGAIRVSRSDCTISNCTFLNNYAAADGGAIFVGDGDDDCLIEECSFDFNIAGQYGGAIYIFIATYDCTITHCSFNNNSASHYENVKKGNRTVMSYCSSTLSEGNITLIVVISCGLVLVAAAVLLIKFKDKIFKKKKEA